MFSIKFLARIKKSEIIIADSRGVKSSPYMSQICMHTSKKLADTAQPPNVCLITAITSPSGSPYGKGRQFTVRISVPHDYPFMAPVFSFDASRGMLLRPATTSVSAIA